MALIIASTITALICIPMINPVGSIKLQSDGAEVRDASDLLLKQINTLTSEPAKISARRRHLKLINSLPRQKVTLGMESYKEKRDESIGQARRLTWACTGRASQSFYAPQFYTRR